QVRRQRFALFLGQLTVEQLLQQAPVLRLFQHAQPVTDHLAGGPVSTRRDLIADKPLLGFRQGDIHRASFGHAGVLHRIKAVSIYATDKTVHHAAIRSSSALFWRDTIWLSSSADSGDTVVNARPTVCFSVPTL